MVPPYIFFVKKWKFSYGPPLYFFGIIRRFHMVAPFKFFETIEKFIWSPLVIFLKYWKFHTVPSLWMNHVILLYVKCKTIHSFLIFINYNIHVSGQDVTKSQNVRGNHVRNSIFSQKIIRGDHMKFSILSSWDVFYRKISTDGPLIIAKKRRRGGVICR